MRPIHRPKSRGQRRYRRHLRVRKKIRGTADRPRLVVYRSLKHIYAQLVDDDANRTLLGLSDRTADLEVEKPGKIGRALAVGKALAARAKDGGVSRVVFDRGGYLFHGRVKAIADGARQGGLEF